MDRHTLATVASTSVACRLGAFILLMVVVAPAALQGQICGNRTPAMPVPEALWLERVIRPGLNGSPGAPLPAERDSTTWDSLRNPGFHNGWEIFEALDIAGDHLFVAYNAGVSVWNLAGAANAENPQRVAVRDGWNHPFCQMNPICSGWLAFAEPGGEDDFLVEDVDALASGQNVYVALAGKYLSLGTTLWEFNAVTEDLTPVYQDLTKISYQVRLVEVADTRGSTRIYAYAANGQGVSVYDVSHALAVGPCLEETGASCPGVSLGDLGTIAGGRFLDVHQRPTGEILLAVTDGRSSNIELELWEITDPADPAAANQLFSGLDDDTFGTALFSYEGNDYLAVVERILPNNYVRIFNINACRGGSCSLGSPLFSFPVPAFSTPQSLTFSTSQATPFLHYGVLGNLVGAQVEQLFDLTTLGRPGQSITELTAGGPTYFDPCVNQNLGYWPWYYPGNEHGRKNLSPRMGKFHPDSKFFYRAARGVLDVHVWESLIFSDGFESGDTSRWSGRVRTAPIATPGRRRGSFAE